MENNGRLRVGEHPAGSLFQEESDKGKGGEHRVRGRENSQSTQASRREENIVCKFVMLYGSLLQHYYLNNSGGK